VMKKVEKLAVAVDRVKACQEIMKEVKKMRVDTSDTAAVKAFREAGKVASDTLKAIGKILFPPENVQGIVRNPDLVPAKLRGLYGLINEIEPLNATQKLVLEQSGTLAEETVRRINRFLENEWSRYRKAAEEAGITPFRELQPVKL